MTTEIELKFIAQAAVNKDLPALLAQFKTERKNTLQLYNDYYDSADNYLRRHKIGLRVRRSDNHYEMTLKDGGKVVAGLHQHMEYNIPLNSPEPDLALLPLTIWPEQTLPLALPDGLQRIFSTNFERARWLVRFADSQIELVQDQGNIVAGQTHQAINEIELELIKGSADALLEFAQQFSEHGGFRLSSQSKAARGYRVIGASAPLQVTPLQTLIMDESSTVEQGFIAALELALEHWQLHEECWIAQQANAQQQILTALMLIRQIWLVWGTMIPCKASESIRLRLVRTQQIIQQADNADEAVWHADYLKSKLRLFHWLTIRKWQVFCNEKAKDKLAMPFKHFADTMLTRTDKALNKEFRNLPGEQAFRSQFPFLQRLMLNLSLFSGDYSVEERQHYFDGWQHVLDEMQNSSSHDWQGVLQSALFVSPFWRTR